MDISNPIVFDCLCLWLVSLMILMAIDTVKEGLETVVHYVTSTLEILLIAAGQWSYRRMRYLLS